MAFLASCTFRMPFAALQVSYCAANGPTAARSPDRRFNKLGTKHPSSFTALVPVEGANGASML
jgi:hypothetical protein